MWCIFIVCAYLRLYHIAHVSSFCDRLDNCFKVMLQGSAHCSNFKSLFRLREIGGGRGGTKLEKAKKGVRSRTPWLVIIIQSTHPATTHRARITHKHQKQTHPTYLVELQTIRKDTPHVGQKRCKRVVLLFYDSN